MKIFLGVNLGKTRGIMSNIIIYEEGKVYQIDEKEIYDPFPDKEWKEASTDEEEQTDELA